MGFTNNGSSYKWDNIVFIFLCLVSLSVFKFYMNQHFIHFFFVIIYKERSHCVWIPSALWQVFSTLLEWTAWWNDNSIIVAKLFSTMTASFAFSLAIYEGFSTSTILLSPTSFQFFLNNHAMKWYGTYHDLLSWDQYAGGWDRDTPGCCFPCYPQSA